MFFFLEGKNLLKANLNTRELKSYSFKKEANQSIYISVERTLPFEYVSKFMPPFLSLWDKDGVFSYSDYDSSLSQISSENNLDVYIFWMDWRLYMGKMEPKQCADWFAERLKNVNKNCPILVNNWSSFWNFDEKQYSANVSTRGWIYQFNAVLEELKAQFAQLEIIDLELLASQLGISSYDYRNDKVSNYPLSNQLTLQVARHISLQLLPALLEPKLKAIVLDLDNTLYNGILGEDGIDGIQLTDEHMYLQRALKNMKENGILLAISSKNDKTDVIEMFEKRTDFPLQTNDFTFIEANWNNKAENIAWMAKQFNFDLSAMLFIDDNPAELMQVQSKLPSLHLLQADSSGKETGNYLLNYPRLYSLRKDSMANKRQQDILANQKRKEIEATSTDGNEYLSSLQMQIGIYENEEAHKQRVFELGQKTNQFNLAIKRLTAGQVDELYNCYEYKIFTITLSDILNDSGIIGVFICRIQDSKIRFEEVLFSCRALGRKVEDVALRAVLTKLQQQEKVQTVCFETVEGPRNKPALNWIETICSNKEGAVSEIIETLNKELKDYPAEVIAHYDK